MKIPAKLLEQAKASFREASTQDLRDRIELIMMALAAHLQMPRDSWLGAEAIYPDKVVVARDGRKIGYPYEVSESNEVTFGEPEEVVQDHRAVRMVEALDVDAAFVEAVADKPGVYLVRIIKAGRSRNGVEYPATVLREAVGKFEGARVFAVADAEHVRGNQKDISKLVGRIRRPRFVEAERSIQAEAEIFESDPIAQKLREAVDRQMAGLFGLSIDADGRAVRRRGFREARSIDRVNSVDLIIDPSAGGEVLRFLEAALQEDDSDVKLKAQMIEEIKQKAPQKLEGLDQADEGAVLAVYREAVAGNNGAVDEGAEEGGGSDGAAAPAVVDIDAQVNAAVDRRVRMVEARAHARSAIAHAKLPPQAKKRLQADFDGREDFTTDAVDAAIQAEADYLGSFKEARIEGLGQSSVQAGEDQADKIRQRLDDFFDPTKPTMSFREAYADITGDRGVTGRLDRCDPAKLREAANALPGELAHFAEAISTSTFSNVLGDSITRAMIRAYTQDERWQDWEYLVDTVPVSDFRTQERTRIGGYGDLPDVAENGPYTALTSPGDEKVTYALTKRGGKETISVETIANDDVGIISRIPRNLGTAAARTLYKFVLDFLRTNPTIYDAVALFHATHNNLGAAGLDEASYEAARLAMGAQAELTSDEVLGLVPGHLTVGPGLEKTAYDLFRRADNHDETFIQSQKPTVHVVPYWTDANDWVLSADKRDTPLIELGFWNGNREPELFVQDNPSQGSLFTNDQIVYKVRHVYSGAVKDFRGFYKAVVA